MKHKVLPLKGYNAIKAFWAFQHLLLGLKMLPIYINQNVDVFFDNFKDMEEGEKETFIRQAVAWVPLEKDEIEAIICFVEDNNGIAYGAANLKNLAPDELHEIIVAVGVELSRFKVNIVSESEKKKLDNSQSTLETLT